MTRDGLFKALANLAQEVEPEDSGVLALIAVVFFACLLWSAWLYPFDGVIVP